MRASVEGLLKRYSKAESRRLDYHDLFESAYELALPQRNQYSGDQEGQSKQEYVYTSEGVKAVNGFVNNMMSSLTPPFTRWVELVAGPAIGEDMKDQLNEVLAKTTDVVFSVMNASNFYTSASEMYYDLAVGTGALLVLEGDETHPVNFICVPQNQIALEEGKHGTIGAVFRKYKLASVLVKQTWRDANYEEKKDREEELIEVTYYDDKSGKWYYEVLIGDEKKRIVERTYNENPWIIVRWSKMPNEVYGRGPLLQALPDLKMLNKGRELAIRSMQLNAFGVYTVADDGTVNTDTMIIEPNAFIPVARNGGPNGPSIAPLPRSGDLNNQMIEFEQLSMSIKEMMLDNRLPPEAGPVRSATEIVERMKQLQTDLASTYGRLMYEFVIPLMNRVVQILKRKGVITLPEGFDKVDNFAVDVSVLSPLAKAQALDDVKNLVNALQILQQIDPNGSLMALQMDLDKTGEYILDTLGVRPDLKNDEAKKEELKQQAVQAAMGAANAQGEQSA